MIAMLIGDVSIPGMLHMPDFYELLLSAKDRRAVIGCDGLLDDMDFLSTGKTLLKSSHTMEAARLLRDQAIWRGWEENNFSHHHHRHRHHHCHQLAIVSLIIFIQKMPPSLQKAPKIVTNSVKHYNWPDGQ
jgi:hypothetical protein